MSKGNSPMILRFGTSVFPVVLLLSLASCGTRELSVDATEAYPPVFASLRDRVLGPRCATCHAKIVQYAEVLTLVSPGHPESSELFHEIDGGDMPKYGGKLTDEEIAAVATWIKNGAKND